MSDEMAMVMDLLWAAPRNDEATVGERRVEMDTVAGVAPLADGTEAEPVEIAGQPAEWLRPPGVADDAALLYLHGGGYAWARSSATGPWPASWP